MIDLMDSSNQNQQPLSMGSSKQKQRQIDDIEGQKEAPKSVSMFSCFSLEYYQTFFDVDTEDVQTRLFLSLKPTKAEFFESIQNNPDMYGPFWVLTTLIVCISAGGNLSRYLNGQTEFSFSFVPSAATIIYGYGSIVPLLVAFVLRSFGSDLNYSHVFCLYGYSFSCFIISTMLCIIPQSSSQWVFLIYGLVNSTAFLLINIWSQLDQFTEKNKNFIIGIVIGLQVVLVFIYKFYFFKQVYVDTK